MRSSTPRWRAIATSPVGDASQAQPHETRQSQQGCGDVSGDMPASPVIHPVSLRTIGQGGLMEPGVVDYPSDGEPAVPPETHPGNGGKLARGACRLAAMRDTSVTVSRRRSLLSQCVR